MKNNHYIPIKIDIKIILLVALLIFSITMILVFRKQTKKIESLKSESAGQKILINNLKNQLSNLEEEKSNLEDQLYELEDIIDELENRRIVITYQ